MGANAVEWWAPRDASWYNYPDVRSVKQLHRMTEKFMAFCNPKTLILDEDSCLRSEQVPASRKCKRCLRVESRRARAEK